MLVLIDLSWDRVYNYRSSMERLTQWCWRLSMFHCLVFVRTHVDSLYLCARAYVRATTTVSIISIVWASQRLASRHHLMSKRIKDDANRCRLATIKHNYGFIRRCNCFVRASQFVLVVHRLLLPLYNAHSHPYLTRYVISDSPFSYYWASLCALFLLSL